MRIVLADPPQMFLAGEGHTRHVLPLGIAYLGTQGDMWDAQKDMAAAMYGSLLCMVLLLLYRRPRLGLSRSVADSPR